MSMLATETRTEKFGSCPCCGAEMQQPRLLVDLHSNTLTYGDVSKHVTPKISELVHVLLAAWPNPVSYDRIGQELYGAFEVRMDPAVTRTRIYAHASFAKQALRAFGADIVASAGHGYSIVDRGYRLVLPQDDLRRSR